MAATATGKAGSHRGARCGGSINEVEGKLLITERGQFSNSLYRREANKNLEPAPEKMGRILD